MPLGANKAAIMGVAGVSTGDVVLLSTQTASNSASILFTSDITSTYGEYIFKFYNINPATDAASFGFQGNNAMMLVRWIMVIPLLEVYPESVQIDL